ncbi:MAG: Uma2 family endonuclease [Cyanobacteria bacterium J06597_16]
MVQSDIKSYLPPGTELPDSDDIPVDNEEQNLLPNILLFVLNTLWATRKDWYFGVDMGVYHETGGQPRIPVVPDAFLSIGVPRFRGNQLRRSYVVWEEDNIPPTLTIEVVSWSPGGEYDTKLEIYRKLGVLYYVIYNPRYWQRDLHQPFEVYKLVEGAYQLQLGEPFWMPEVGLGIGRHQGTIVGNAQEMLSWFDEKGDRILTTEERANQLQSKADRLAARLREMGEDPEEI